MPVKYALMSTLNGAAFGMFPIAWIVFASIMLYRLAVVPIQLPPLRERPRDIPGLVDHFLAKHGAKHRAVPPRLDAETLQLLVIIENKLQIPKPETFRLQF